MPLPRPRISGSTPEGIWQICYGNQRRCRIRGAAKHGQWCLQYFDVLVLCEQVGQISRSLSGWVDWLQEYGGRSQSIVDILLLQFGKNKRRPHPRFGPRGRAAGHETNWV